MAIKKPWGYDLWIALSGGIRNLVQSLKKNPDSSSATSVPGDDDSNDKSIRPTKGLRDLVIDVLTWLFPSIECAVMGHAIGGESLGRWLSGCFIVIWSAVFVKIGLWEIRQQDYIALERFGRFYTVKYRGIRWRNWFFDRVVERSSVTARAHILYSKTKQEDEIDFQDVSTPIDATAWYSICNPVDVANENWEALTLQIARNLYRFDDPDTRADELIDSAVRPALEALTTDEAKGPKGEAATTKAVEEIAPALAAIGRYPPAHKPIVIRDIALTQKQRENRDAAMAGQAEAKRQAQVLTGPALAIDQILKHAESVGHTMTYREAADMVERAQTNSMLKETKAGLTIVAKDVGGVYNALTLPTGRSS